jgi:L-lactate dehydrogenase complex protein LldG
MDIEMTSKAEILRRIRAANGGVSTEQVARGGCQNLSRNYKRAGVLQPEAVLQLLEDRLRDYDATVRRTDRHGLSLAVASLLDERSKHHIVIPSGIPSEWLPQGFMFVVDEILTPTQLDAFDGVLTCATLAIAETGTVVLQSVPGQGRRAISLVPDYHLCLVRVEDVVETVPQAFQRLHSAAAIATTFISGPSATADIEMTRIKGVHGPRVLDVLLIA